MLAVDKTNLNLKYPGVWILSKTITGHIGTRQWFPVRNLKPIAKIVFACARPVWHLLPIGKAQKEKDYYSPK